MSKKCARCGREFEPEHRRHRFCSDCYRPRRRSRRMKQPASAEAETSAPFAESYLPDGYFGVPDDQLQPAVVDSLAIETARYLLDQELDPAYLWTILNRSREISARLAQGADFEMLQTDLRQLTVLAAELADQKVVPTDFRDFIERTVTLALADERSFQEGFLLHLESVWAYLTYFAMTAEAVI